MTISDVDLFNKALDARGAAHAVYSGFLVGAAILDEKGNVHIGCNVENAAYPLGACAEVGAISAMVAAGGKVIKRIAIVGAKREASVLDVCPPCGGCRQRIAEFADATTKILLQDTDENISEHSWADLLPGAFKLS